MPRSRLAAQAVASVRPPDPPGEPTALHLPQRLHRRPAARAPRHREPKPHLPHPRPGSPLRPPRQPSTQQPLHSATHPARNTTLPPYTSLNIWIYSYTAIHRALLIFISPDLSQYRHFSSPIAIHTATHVRGNTDPEPLAASDTPLPASNKQGQKASTRPPATDPGKGCALLQATPAPYPNSPQKEQMP